MAKTFGTGADPKGLVNRGVEGSGAAQIFRPSQAVQDFVTGQRQQGLQKQKQKQAEAKAKAERQKELDKYTVDLVAETFMQPDNEKSLAMFSEIQTELAKFKMQGVDPRTQPEFQKKVYEAKQFNNIIKNQREDYNKALNNLNAISKDANYTPEQIDDFTARLQAYTVAEPDARFSIDITAPLKPLKVDWFKNKQQLIKGTKYKVEEIEIGGLGEKTEITEKVTKDTIDANWNSYMASPNYKQEVKDYQKTFNVSEEEAGNMAKADYVAALPTKYRQKYDADKGGVNINYGDGKITSYYTEAFFSPESYNNLKDRVPELGIFSPAAAMQISDEGAIMFKGRKGKEPPPMLIPNADGTTSPFKLNAIFKKKDGNYAAVGIRGIYDENGRFLPNVKSTININEYNKRDVEETYLGGVEIDKAFESFKANRKSAQPTAPKTVTGTPKEPNRTIDLSKFDKSKK